MAVDCSMTNWSYNSIKAKWVSEGGGDKQGGEGSSQWTGWGCSFESLIQIPVTQGWPGVARPVISADVDLMTSKATQASGLGLSPGRAGQRPRLTQPKHARRRWADVHVSARVVCIRVGVEEWKSRVESCEARTEVWVRPHRRDKKNHPNVCLPRQHRDPLRPTGGRPSC